MDLKSQLKINFGNTTIVIKKNIHKLPIGFPKISVANLHHTLQFYQEDHPRNVLKNHKIGYQKINKITFKCDTESKMG